jgi:NAD+ synthase (glutamine-hydrolysing)
MAQINSTVGAIEKNSKKILAFIKKAKARECDVVVFPELALTGYPPEDLLLKQGFVDANMSEIEKLAKEVRGIGAIVGFVEQGEDGIYNAAAVLDSGRVVGVYQKMLLPNYGVFDEERYFLKGSSPLNIKINGITVGIGICEDLWFKDGPARASSRAGAELIININASPYYFGKSLIREDMVRKRAVENNVSIVYNNAVGGQDELVFDGHGLIVNEKGAVTLRTPSFSEALVITDIEFGKVRVKAKRCKAVKKVLLKGRGKKIVRSFKEKPLLAAPSPMEEVLNALTLGVKDYVKKNGFTRCVVALSGGVDSALVAVIAARAIGGDKIIGVYMPTVFSSPESGRDARHLAKNLGIEFQEIAIQALFEDYLKTLKKSFKGRAPDVTEENIQARVRGNIIMALSNKFGHLVLTTGNKSEMSVGYATLYGDMAGGFAVIKDVPKLMVYELSRYINEREGREVIPSNIITRPPSAELRPDQTDQDTLPPYEVLDPILKAYVEDDLSINEITALGFNARTVKKVIRMVDLSEYKRRQAPPGIKITPKAFGRDRRMPITNGYKNG